MLPRCQARIVLSSDIVLQWLTIQESLHNAMRMPPIAAFAELPGSQG